MSPLRERSLYRHRTPSVSTGHRNAWGRGQTPQQCGCRRMRKKNSLPKHAHSHARREAHMDYRTCACTAQRMPPRSQACGAPETAEAQHGGQGAYRSRSDVSEEIVAGKVPTRPGCPLMVLQRKPSNEETSADESNAGRRQRQHIACGREQLHAHTSGEPSIHEHKGNSAESKRSRRESASQAHYGSWRVPGRGKKLTYRVLEGACMRACVCACVRACARVCVDGRGADMRVILVRHSRLPIASGRVPTRVTTLLGMFTESVA